jgi:hypothetical protein
MGECLTSSPTYTERFLPVQARGRFTPSNGPYAWLQVCDNMILLRKYIHRIVAVPPAEHFDLI